MTSGSNYRKIHPSCENIIDDHCHVLSKVGENNQRKQKTPKCHNFKSDLLLCIQCRYNDECSDSSEEQDSGAINMILKRRRSGSSRKHLHFVKHKEVDTSDRQYHKHTTVTRKTGKN